MSSDAFASFPKWRVFRPRWPSAAVLNPGFKSHGTHKQSGVAFSITDPRQHATYAPLPPLSLSLLLPLLSAAASSPSFAAVRSSLAIDRSPAANSPFPLFRSVPRLHSRDSRKCAHYRIPRATPRSPAPIRPTRSIDRSTSPPPLPPPSPPPPPPSLRIDSFPRRHRRRTSGCLGRGDPSRDITSLGSYPHEDHAIAWNVRGRRAGRCYGKGDGGSRRL